MRVVIFLSHIVELFSISGIVPQFQLDTRMLMIELRRGSTIVEVKVRNITSRTFFRPQHSEERSFIFAKKINAYSEHRVIHYL